MKMNKLYSRQNIFITLSLLIGVLIISAVWMKQFPARDSGSEEYQHPQYVGPADVAHTEAFGKAFIPANSQWSTYTNIMFGFSMDLPPEMETHHVANLLKLNEKEYIQYIIEFIGSAHSASDQRHIEIAIQKTDFTSVKEYLPTVAPLDAGYYEEKQAPSGIFMVVIPHQSIDSWKQQQIVKETDVFFIKDGSLFHLSFNMIETGDFERIINSIKISLGSSTVTQ
jgi:hypothetical protein